MSSGYIHVIMQRMIAEGTGQDDLVNRRTANTIDAVRRMRGVSVAGLARMLGSDTSRQFLEPYLKGRRNITVPLLVDLATALAVEPYVLLMDARDAQRWVLDNPGTSTAPVGDGAVTKDVTAGYVTLDEYAA